MYLGFSSPIFIGAKELELNLRRLGNFPPNVSCFNWKVSFTYKAKFPQKVLHGAINQVQVRCQFQKHLEIDSFLIRGTAAIKSSAVQQKLSSHDHFKI